MTARPRPDDSGQMAGGPVSVDAFQVHAFTTTLHSGNPAGVCILDTWPDDAVLARVAIDFGPSVTAFVLRGQRGAIPIRWFTRSGSEVKTFCGHATFAAAHALRQVGDAQADLVFESRSGRYQFGFVCDDAVLKVPRWDAELLSSIPDWVSFVGGQPVQVLIGPRDALVVYRHSEEVRALRPDFEALRQAKAPAVIACSPDVSEDVVFRFFCPGFPIGEDEDLATGSALCTLVPYWSKRLAKSDLSVAQVSERGGYFEAQLVADGVVLRSGCVTFFSGTLSMMSS